MNKGTELLEIIAAASAKDWHNVKVDYFAGWHDAWQISAVKKDVRWLIGYSTDTEGAGIAAHRARVFLGMNQSSN